MQLLGYLDALFQRLVLPRQPVEPQFARSSCWVRTVA
jgi:hypothetical protein